MQNSKLVERALLFAVAIMETSVLVTYFLRFGIGFMMSVFMFIGIILYIQSRESKESDFNDVVSYTLLLS
ncbi:MAG: hypothetical protein M3P08_06815 [Thermoproteota archaeon]|nr:hypothetical protein [Thermoproteota archaeon]